MALDNPNLLLNIICFFFPWIGAIVYLAIKDVSPRKARSLGKASLIGGVLQLAIILVISILAWRVQSYMHTEITDTMDEMLKEEAAQNHSAEPEKPTHNKRIKQ